MKYVVVVKNLLTGILFEREFDSPYKRNIFKNGSDFASGKYIRA